jgi:hypothetical protein
MLRQRQEKRLSYDALCRKRGISSALRSRCGWQTQIIPTKAHCPGERSTAGVFEIRHE